MLLKVYQEILLIVPSYIFIFKLFKLPFIVFIFSNLILADEPFSKALRFLETCILVNNNKCGKLVSSFELPITNVEN